MDEIHQVERSDPDSLRNELLAELHKQTKYGALRVISFILRLIAVLIVAFALVIAGLLVRVSPEVAAQLGVANSSVVGYSAAIVLILAAAISALLLWGRSELIQLLIDIEENTRTNR